MASNSLLECLVFAKAASQDIIQRLGETTPPPTLPEWDESRVTQSREEIIVAHDWDELRRVMWDYVGIVRSNERLNRAMRRIRLLSHEVDEYYTHYNVTNDLLELRNLVLIAKLIVRSALARQESRGLHFTLDYPEADSNHLKNTILKP